MLKVEVMASMMVVVFFFIRYVEKGKGEYLSLLESLYCVERGDDFHGVMYGEGFSFNMCRERERGGERNEREIPMHVLQGASTSNTPPTIIANDSLSF